MKRIYTHLVLSLLAVTLPASALIVRGGDITSGGGDSLVMAFTIAGQRACLYLQASKPDAIPISFETFCRAVAGGVKVTSEDLTILNGVEVDAINTPEAKTIVLSQRRNKGKDIYALKQLAVHEYLAVLGVDDSAFRFSGPIAVKLAQETDYFPVRYCEAQSTLQVGSGLLGRLAERSFLSVKFRTDFENADGANFWFDFSGPLRFVRDKGTREKIEVLRWLADLAPRSQKCADLQDVYHHNAGSICVSYTGNRDLLTDYISDFHNPRTMLSIKLSKLRSVNDVQFINPAEENPYAEFTAASGYFDSLGYQGTHLLFEKALGVLQSNSATLQTFGAERFTLDCY